MVTGGIIMVNWNNKKEVSNYITLRAKQLGMPEQFIPVYLKQLERESGLIHYVSKNGKHSVKRGGSGEYGIGQIMPETAKSLGINPSDPVQNIDGSIKYMINALAHYNGDYRKALMAYNAGFGAVDKGRIPESSIAYANEIIKSAGTPTGAAAPIPPTTDANSDLGDRMANLVQNNVDLATQGIANYASTPYDARQALMLRALRQAEAERYMNKVVNETPLNPSAQQVAEANKPFETNVQNLKDVTNQGLNQIQGIVDANRYQDYINQLNQAYNEQLSRLQAANPYTQMGQIAPLSEKDVRDAIMLDEINKGNTAGLAALRGDYSQPAANYARARLEAQRAAEMARQTGLTPEQFIQGRTADYNNMALALAQRNKEFAAILSAAQQGDVSAMSAVNSIINNAMSNMTTSAANQATAQHNLAQDQIARAKENRERYFDMLKYQGGLDPNMVNAGANIQQQNISTAGGMYNTGLNSGTNAAGNLSDYEGKMLSGTTGEIMKPPTAQQAISTLFNAEALNPDPNAFQNAKRSAAKAYSAAGVPDAYLIPFLNQDNQ